MKTELIIEGMSCGHCVRSVKQALEGVPGVEKAEVDLESKRAVIEHSASPADLIAAVEEEGYQAKEA